MLKTWAAVAVLALAATGCAQTAGAPDDGRLDVVTTVAPLTSIAATATGDRVRVTGREKLTLIVEPVSQP